MVLMDSLYRIILHPITFILSPFSTKYIILGFRSRVDMVSNLNLIFMIFALSLFLSLKSKLR